jgi:hypothetical protein
VSRETLRKWMQDAGIWLSRKQRRTFHQPRLRRECYGELIQIDGSDHHWFEDRGPACTLLVFIDDATSTLMHLEFVTSESTFSYFGALEAYLHEHGRPVAFYSDNQLAFSYDRQRIILAENEITRGLPGKYVDSYEYPDGRLEFRWKGVALPYSIFDKDQRLTHAAITENKHLSAVLEHIKAEQDKTPPKKRRAGKQRSRYKPTGRRNDGWNSLADRKRIADRKASQGCDI